MKSDYTPHEKKLRHLKARTKARPILKACPKCGSPLVKTREEKLLFWDYGGAVEETVEYYKCADPRCPNHKREFSPTKTMRAPGIGVSKRVLADLLVWRKHGKTAKWFRRYVHPTKVYLSGSYMRAVYTKYKKMFAMPPKPSELEEFRRSLADPVVLIEVVEPERAPKSHLLLIAKEVITGKTVYSWLTAPEMLRDPTYVLGIIDRRLGGKLRRIITDNKTLYEAIKRIRAAVPALISTEPLRTTTVLSMLPSWKTTPITIIGFFDAKRLVDIIRGKAYIPKHSKPEKQKMLRFLDEILSSELSGDPIAKSIGIMETLRLVLDTDYYERNKLKGGKKAPWRDRRTRSVLIDLLRESVRDLEEETVLKIIGRAVERLGPPWQLADRGRKPMYDPKKLAPLAILGLIYSYRKAARLARAIKYDAMFPEARYRYGLRFPSKSLLQYVVQEKIKEDYLDAVLESVWREIRSLAIVKFIFGNSIEFVIDGTGLPARWLRLTMRRGEPALVHESIKVYYNVDINLNAIIRIFVPRASFTIGEVVDHLTAPVEGGFGYLDPEFASKDAISILRERLSGYALKRRDGSIDYFCRDNKCAGSYSRRKLGEIPPGNFALRNIRIMAAAPSDKAKEVVAKAGIRHNILALLRWSALSKRFRPILLPVGRFDVSFVASNHDGRGDSRMSMNSISINNMPAVSSVPIIYTLPIIIA